MPTTLFHPFLTTIDPSLFLRWGQSESLLFVRSFHSAIKRLDVVLSVTHYFFREVDWADYTKMAAARTAPKRRPGAAVA
jgi:hypothetical protein